MMQKVEKLLDLAAEALSLYIRKTTAELGEALPLTDIKQLNIPEAPVTKPKRTSKVKVPAAATEDAPSPFGTATPAAEPTAAAKPSIEDAQEAQRRCQEVMVAFIRRFKDSKPNGPLRAQQLVLDTCGRKVSDFAALQYEDHVKLIPVFEKELDAVAVVS